MSNQTAEPRKNFTRTWEARLYGDWGEGRSASVLIATKIITVTADHEGTQTATIDGQPADLLAAYQLYQWAKYEDTLTLLHEADLTPPPAPMELPPATIGKARAQVLHKIMGALGLCNPQHYAVAAFALDEPFALDSLSTLTENEAGRVWKYLCSQYSNARAVADALKLKTPVSAA